MNWVQHKDGKKLVYYMGACVIGRTVLGVNHLWLLPEGTLQYAGTLCSIKIGCKSGVVMEDAQMEKCSYEELKDRAYGGYQYMRFCKRCLKKIKELGLVQENIGDE